jgi:hypothetical protein
MNEGRWLSGVPVRCKSWPPGLGRCARWHRHFPASPGADARHLWPDIHRFAQVPAFSTLIRSPTGRGSLTNMIRPASGCWSRRAALSAPAGLDRRSAAHVPVSRWDPSRADYSIDFSAVQVYNVDMDSASVSSACNTRKRWYAVRSSILQGDRGGLLTPCPVMPPASLATPMRHTTAMKLGAARRPRYLTWTR